MRKEQTEHERTPGTSWNIVSPVVLVVPLSFGLLYGGAMSSQFSILWRCLGSTLAYMTCLPLSSTRFHISCRHTQRGQKGNAASRDLTCISCVYQVQ